jgi:hypothetical protein
MRALNAAQRSRVLRNRVSALPAAAAAERRGDSVLVAEYVRNDVVGGPHERLTRLDVFPEHVDRAIARNVARLPIDILVGCGSTAAAAVGSNEADISAAWAC